MLTLIDWAILSANAESVPFVSDNVILGLRLKDDWIVSREGYKIEVNLT